jgi:putative spermidine/putrescine transport system substrate-binding protein
MTASLTFLRRYGAAALCTAGCAAAWAQTITVANFGGANAKAQQTAFYTPFEAANSGVKVQGVEYPGDLVSVAAQLKKAKPDWDVVEVESADLAKGCAAGYFEPVQRASIAHASMLLPGTVQECGLGAFVWSTVMAYDSQRYAKDAPKNWADFFDTKRFPGKRGLRKGVRYNLEIALLADGVHRRDVYTQLATPAGVQRALQKLEQLKPHIVWWESGAQPPQRLLEGSVVMTTAFNGRIAAANAGQSERLAIVWSDAIYEMDYWTVLRNSPNKAQAQDFVRFATTEPAQLAFSRAIPYGPTHMQAILRYEENRPTRSRTTDAGGNAHAQVIDLSMLPSDLPSAPANLRRSLAFDTKFWGQHGPALEQQFAQRMQ